MITLLALALAAQQPADHPSAGPVQQVAPATADRRTRRVLQRRLEGAGELYETLGRCVGSMSPEEVQWLLSDAATQPGGEYLAARFAKGTRHTRESDDWCRRQVDRTSARLTRR